MKIKKLDLQNFKNYENLTVEYSDRINLILGKNGMGKTNILDAIHYLAFTKGAFGTTDNQNIRKEESYFLVKGQFTFGKREKEVICFHEKRKKKVFKIDQVPCEKYSDHIGEVPLVLSTPYDTDLVRDASEVRRKWIDGFISQFDSSYLHNLMAYQRILKQRNALLKQIEGHLSTSNELLLDGYDGQLIKLSMGLYEVRDLFVKEFQPYLKQNLEQIVVDHEQCTVEYQSQMSEESFSSLFGSSRQKDLITQRTNYGAHKDDFPFLMDGEPLKKFGSQGQQKSFLISLRLAQYDYLKAQKGQTPLLLLDDVFDKLDDNRIMRLIQLLKDDDRFGQVFITDARKERAAELTGSHTSIKIFEIEEGTLVDEKG